MVSLGASKETVAVSDSIKDVDLGRGSSGILTLMCRRPDWGHVSVLITKTGSPYHSTYGHIQGFIYIHSTLYLKQYKSVLKELIVYVPETME